MNILAIFVLVLIFTALLQGSVVALPLGMMLIILWYINRDTKNLGVLVLIFSISLAVVANISIWIIVASTTISLYLFILGRSFLPAKIGISFGLCAISLVVWELSVAFLSKINL